MNKLEKGLTNVLGDLWPIALVIIGIIIFLSYYVIIEYNLQTQITQLVNNHDCKGLTQFGEQHQDYLDWIIKDKKLEGCI